MNAATTNLLPTIAQTLPVQTHRHYEASTADDVLVLGEVLDQVRESAAQLDHSSHDRMLKHCHVRWGEQGRERARLQRMVLDTGNGQPGLTDGMPMTRTALVQLLNRDVLPRHGRNFLEELLNLSFEDAADRRHPRATEADLKLVDAVTARFLRTRGHKARRLLHVNRNGERVIRGVVGTSYNEYLNVDLLEDVLSGLPDEAAEWPVLSLRLTDDLLRVRFLAERRDLGTGRAHRILTADEGKVIPAIELWNSETGRRAVYLKSLGYRALCANGYASLAESTVYRWNHTGHRDRLRNGVSGALQDVMIGARQIAADYDDALMFAVDDAWAYMQPDLTDLANHERDAVREALDAPTTTNADGGPKLLASMLDAVTLAAHELHDVDDGDLLRVEAMETTAARLMRRGLAEGREHGRLTAPRKGREVVDA